MAQQAEPPPVTPAPHTSAGSSPRCSAADPACCNGPSGVPAVAGVWGDELEDGRDLSLPLCLPNQSVFKRTTLKAPSSELAGSRLQGRREASVHQHKRQTSQGHDRGGCVPDPLRGLPPSPAWPCQGVSPSRTVPACSARPTAWHPWETLITGKMCHGAESPGCLLPPPGPWTALLASGPQLAGPRSEQVQVDPG